MQLENVNIPASIAFPHPIHKYAGSFSKNNETQYYLREIQQL